MKKLILNDKHLLVALFITIIIRTTIYIASLFQVESLSNFLTIWTRWDTSWYIAIAEKGYITEGKDALAIVFYPGYPMLIKLINIITEDSKISSLFISLFFSLTSTFFLYKLVVLDYSKNIALKAVWFLNIFPTSYFLQAGYTESTFLTFTLASFYFFRQKKLTPTSVTGIMATLTRVNGLLLIPALLTEIMPLKDTIKVRAKKLITLLIISWGTCLYLLINFFTFGDFFYFTKVLNDVWYKHFSPPWEGVRNLYNNLPARGDAFYSTFLAELITIILLAIMLPFIWKIRKSYAVYVFTNLLLITSTSFILSTPRYALMLFPIYIVFACIKNKILTSIITILSILLLTYFSNLFITGQWAF